MIFPLISGCFSNSLDIRASVFLINSSPSFSIPKAFESILIISLHKVCQGLDLYAATGAIFDRVS
ncbi:Uncharacterised protein [Streptococcus pneumoniae]|nr:Uncharacterised protein [Streptococcus pneumoniae]